MASADKNAPHSRMRQVEMELTGQILEGVYAPGDRLPPEAELVKRFDVSRQTVNKAIRELAKCGLVTRNRRAGTVVTRKFHQTFMLPLADVRDMVSARGSVYGFRLRRQEMLANSGGTFFWPELPAGAGVLHVELVHYADDVPVMLETRHINLAAAPGARDVDFSETAPSPWLLANVPWSSVRHRLDALSCGGDLAAALDLAPGTACMAIERKTYHLETPITRVRMVIAGDRLEIAGDFTLPTL